MYGSQIPTSDARRLLHQLPPSSSSSALRSFSLVLAHGRDLEPVAQPRPLPTSPWKQGRPGRDVVEEELLCVRRWRGRQPAGAGDPENHDLHRAQQGPEQRAGTEQLLPQQRSAGQSAHGRQGNRVVT